MCGRLIIDNWRKIEREKGTNKEKERKKEEIYRGRECINEKVL